MHASDSQPVSAHGTVIATAEERLRYRLSVDSLHHQQASVKTDKTAARDHFSERGVRRGQSMHRAFHAKVSPLAARGVGAL